MQILYTCPTSIYPSLVGAENCWDKHRNALKYTGGEVIVAHPPCRKWGQMRGLSTAPEAEKDLAKHAAQLVNLNGGVLEHPIKSTLFTKHPELFLSGLFLEISQWHWGHKATKLTTIYVVGLSLTDFPSHPLRAGRARHVCCGSKLNASRDLELPRKERDETPHQFAEWLIEIARRIEINKSQ